MTLQGEDQHPLPATAQENHPCTQMHLLFHTIQGWNYKAITLSGVNKLKLKRSLSHTLRMQRRATYKSSRELTTALMRIQRVINEAPALNKTTRLLHEVRVRQLIFLTRACNRSFTQFHCHIISKPNAWDGETRPISIFGTMEFLEIDSKNMFMSLLIWLTILGTERSEKGK